MDNFAPRILATIVGIAIAAIPTLLFFGVRELLSPEGFSQEFFVLGIGIWIFGGMQIVFFFIWLFAMFLTWAMS